MFSLYSNWDNYEAEQDVAFDADHSVSLSSNIKQNSFDRHLGVFGFFPTIGCQPKY